MNPSRLAPLVIAVGALWMFPSSAWAQKGGGHGGGHAGGARTSSGTVHVRGYDRKDGTHVEGYDRGPHAAGETSLGELAKQTAAARSARSTGAGAASTAHTTGSAGSAGTSTTGYSHGGLYSIKDPATGRVTFTDHLSAATSSTRTAAPAAVTRSTSLSVAHSATTRTATTSSRSRTMTSATKASRTTTTGRATSHAAAKSNTAAAPTVYRSNRCTNCDRDSHGRILRSAEAKDAFKRATGYPNGRPGYVIDHIKPLACGGADSPSNMQWQTVAAAKAKDAVERQGCGK